MQYRSFKGNKVSEVGLGTWQLGSADWGVINEEEAFGILQEFLDRGGNFIDTADVYGMGISEKNNWQVFKECFERKFCGN